MKIIGIRFRTSAKVYYFDPDGATFKVYDKAVVETARGVELGTVLLVDKEVDPETVPGGEIKKIIRKATEEDIEKYQQNMDMEKEAIKSCQEKVRARELDMKLVGAEYTLDGSKLTFYYTAEGYIDFRELVKDLAGIFHIRIELRQIGVRNDTQMKGCFGVCGREVCCKSFIGDFGSVSIKMAKEQNLSLNPTKISGVCGRLMCCLAHEEETYEYLNSKLPMMNDTVTTPDGQSGVVVGINVLRQIVKVEFEEDGEKERKDFPVGELRFRPRKHKLNIPKNDDDSDNIEILSESDYDKKEKSDNRERHQENRERRDNHENRDNRERKNKKDRFEHRDNHHDHKHEKPQDNNDSVDNNGEGRDNRPHKRNHHFKHKNKKTNDNTGNEQSS